MINLFVLQISIGHSFIVWMTRVLKTICFERNFSFLLLLFVHFSFSFNLCLWGFFFSLQCLEKEEEIICFLIIKRYNHLPIHMKFDGDNLQLLNFFVIVVVVVVLFFVMYRKERKTKGRRKKTEESENKSILNLT